MRIVDTGILARGKEGTSRACHTFAAFVTLANGACLATCRAGTTKDSEDERILLFRSGDSGRSWQEAGEPFGVQKLNGVAGSLKVCYITELKPGHLMAACLWVDRETYPGRRLFNEETEGCLPMAIFLSESYDEGGTWSPLRAVEMPEEIGPPSLTNPLLRLSDGSIALGIETNKHYEDTGIWRQKVVLFLSPDEGRRWGPPLTVARDPDHHIFYWDQRAGVAADGRIAAFHWTYDREQQKYLDVHRCISSDNGRTWSPGEGLGFTDQPSNPAILDDGSVVVAYVDRFGTHSIRARKAPGIDRPFDPQSEVLIYSHDRERTGGAGGQTAAELLGEMLLWAFGLPFAGVLPGGDVLVLYYAGNGSAMDIRWARLEP